MKRFIALTMLFALLLSFAACGGKQDNEAAASAEPTEAVTAEATEAANTQEAATPTPEAAEDPTPEPTETPEPTATPEPVEVAFEDCVEVVARLPWGTADDEVYYLPPDESEWLLPLCFCVADGRIYILDKWYSYPGGSFAVYDTESGEITRLDVPEPERGIKSEFIIDGGRLITPDMIYDLETGAVKLLQRPDYNGGLSTDCVRRLVMKDGECYIYVAEPHYGGGSYNFTPLVTEYLLDEENLLWKPMCEYCRESTRQITLYKDGIYLFRDTQQGSDEYLGRDAEGRHYVFSRELLIRESDGHESTRFVISRFTPEGYIDEYTSFEMPEHNRHPEMAWSHYLRVDEDGTVWFMMMYEEEVVFYKITL